MRNKARLKLQRSIEEEVGGLVDARIERKNIAWLKFQEITHRNCGPLQASLEVDGDRLYRGEQARRLLLGCDILPSIPLLLEFLAKKLNRVGRDADVHHPGRIAYLNLGGD